MASGEILQLLDNRPSYSYEFDDGALTLVGTTLEDNVPFVGKTVKEAAQIARHSFHAHCPQRKATQYTEYHAVTPYLKHRIRYVLLP